MIYWYEQIIQVTQKREASVFITKCFSLQLISDLNECLVTELSVDDKKYFFYLLL